MRHDVGQQPTGCLGGHGLLGNAQDRPQVRVDIERIALARSPGFQASVNPPSRHGATLSG